MFFFFSVTSVFGNAVRDAHIKEHVTCSPFIANLIIDVYVSLSITDLDKCSKSNAVKHLRPLTFALRLRSHRNIRYTVYGIRYTLFGIQYTLYGHGGSHRSSTCCQCALFVSMKKSCKVGVLHIHEDSNICLYCAKIVFNLVF